MTGSAEWAMHVKVRGINYYCELSGRASAPVVALSHSLGSSMLMWEPQRAELERRYQVLRIDTVGHGRSAAPPGPYDLDSMAADVVMLLDALAIERVHWVGLSMGGMIGQGLALDHADRLHSLVLSDTMAVVGEEAQPVWRERIELAQHAGMTALAQSTMERWFTDRFRDQHPERVLLIKSQFINTPVAGYTGCCAAIRRLEYLSRLDQVRLPTLVLVGADDPATPVAAAEAIQAQIAESELTVIGDAAHLSNMEQPRRFNAAVLAFLEHMS
jgi:3-oxoadipate enol-lactonase